ncbi:MAG: hypothetical protein SFV54_24550 [Bryobacteraceae bacterium]|nr:hypothetical protein [Bryobacteraceae bacterium]
MSRFFIPAVYGRRKATAIAASALFYVMLFVLAVSLITGIRSLALY